MHNWLDYVIHLKINLAMVLYCVCLHQDKTFSSFLGKKDPYFIWIFFVKKANWGRNWWEVDVIVKNISHQNTIFHSKKL